MNTCDISIGTESANVNIATADDCNHLIGRGSNFNDDWKFELK